MEKRPAWCCTKPGTILPAGFNSIRFSVGYFNFRERLAMFGLELHPDKTRRIEFGRYAEENRKRRGERKPETFDFLGFTHISRKNSLGRLAVRRKTICKRMRAKLRRIKPELRKRMHDPLSV
jgi:hypothetical protein